MLLPDGALALEHEDVHNEADVEERDLLERHEALEPIERLTVDLLHDRAADVLEQLVERAEEHARVQTGLGVEGAELDALLDVLHPVLALHHRHQVLPLELARPLRDGAARDQGAGVIEARKMVEERCHVIIGVLRHQVPDRRDARQVRRLEADDLLPALDVRFIEPHLAQQGFGCGLLDRVGHVSSLFRRP